MMRTLRETVGNGVDLMIDFHGRPGSASAAIQFIKSLEPYDPLFVEEVIQPGELKRAKADKRKNVLSYCCGRKINFFS